MSQLWDGGTAFDPACILAIVGSTRFANPNAYALALPEIVLAVEALRPAKIISGEADGMDAFAKAYAVTRGIPYQGFPPAHPQWEPHGYKERNMQIAAHCTHLLAIRCQASSTYGSGFTADQAETAGRQVRRITVPIAGMFAGAKGDWIELAR